MLLAQVDNFVGELQTVHSLYSRKIFKKTFFYIDSHDISGEIGAIRCHRLLLVA